MRAIDLSGCTFGRLTVLARDGSDAKRQAKWLCQCQCGTIKTIAGASLKKGTTKACGCLHVERTRAMGLANADKLYDGLTLHEHSKRSGVPYSTLTARVRKHSHPFPAHIAPEAHAEQAKQRESMRGQNIDGFRAWLGKGTQ
ncbi:hypothetical protein [Paraburkholderia haematera]|uniref:Uncharacterized protein n=1 Tax=Paraburkholderia haematera TaxID=2793077 RepID=A0ABM8QT81_9BURK|nr:hypothetical protein [Paraburkholderia haematera]CAE6714128.1 hypothetical protein R69888_01290 [Paraburkholderia haematera]